MANVNPATEVSRVLGQSPSTASAGVAEQLTTITQQLQQLQAINQKQVETVEANTQAVAQNSSVRETEGAGSVAKSVGSAVTSFFGLGLSPLISGLVSLFGGGGGQSSPPPLVPYVAPPSVTVNAGVGSAGPGAFAVDPADGGLPRPAPASTQITVHVQAMDSKSFLDHSNDIAMAVRQAMLESTALNDVIREV